MAEQRESHGLALAFKAKGEYAKAVRELETIQRRGDGIPGYTNWLIAALYLYELESVESALRFASAAVKESPLSERASICLVHCLVALGNNDAVTEEIRRFVATGSELREYEQLFAENGVSVADYT